MIIKILRKIKNRIDKFIKNNWIAQYLERKNFYKLFEDNSRVRILIIGAPEYDNLGDSAILLGQYNCIKQAIPDGDIIEISRTEYYKYREFIINNVKLSDVLTGIGGGNMGDEWIIEENLRRDLINDFSGYSIIIFPQTIFYNNTNFGEVEKEKSISIYNRKELTLIARERESYNMMKKIYQRAHIILTPDIVLSLDEKDFGIKDTIERTNLLLCLRSDEEKMLTNEDENKIRKAVNKQDYPIKYLDMHAGCAVTKRNRMKLLHERMKEFARSKVVITDRLHGMIFAAISGTPCIVFGNYNHKISGSFEWISRLGYIRFLDSVDDIDETIDELINYGSQKYDKTLYSDYFNQIVDYLSNETRRK